MSVGARGWPAERSNVLREWVQGHRDELLEQLRLLTNLDAPTGDPEALEMCAQVVYDMMAQLGANVRRVPSPTGTHLEGTLTVDERPPVILLCHYDTVWPRGTVAARPMEIREDQVVGPGVYDMRGGLVACLGAVQALQQTGGLTRSVTILVTADEESGSLGSAEHIVRIARDACVVLVPEPPIPGGGIKTRRKGAVRFRLDVDGRAAHAGLDPESGIDAISHLHCVINSVQHLAWPERGSTINVGRIGGGVHIGVVPPAAFAEVEIRAKSRSEFERLRNAARAIPTGFPGKAIRVSMLYERPPMERTPAIGHAADRAKAIAAQLGLTLDEGASGGLSDSNLIAPLGVPIVDGLGPDGGGAHAVTEHISVASFEDRVVLISKLIENL